MGRPHVFFCTILYYPKSYLCYFLNLHVFLTTSILLRVSLHFFVPLTWIKSLLTGALIVLICTWPNYLKWLSLFLASIEATHTFKQISPFCILYFLLCPLFHLKIFISIRHPPCSYLRINIFISVWHPPCSYSRIQSYSISISLWIIDTRYQKLSLFDISWLSSFTTPSIFVFHCNKFALYILNLKLIDSKSSLQISNLA